MDNIHDTDDITTGSTLLGPTGRIWTVRAITPNRARVILTSDEPDGRHGAVMDVVAVSRMVRIEQPGVATSPADEPTDAPAADLVRS